MRITKTDMRSALLVITSSVLLVSTPVFAEHGTTTTVGSDATGSTTTSGSTSGSSGTEHTTTTSTTSTEGSGDKPKTPVVVTTENNTGGDANHPELHKSGNDLVTELEKDHKGKSAGDIEKACTAHKQGLTTKFNAIVTNSQKIQDRINDILTKAETFQQSSKTTPTDYATLLAAAQAAQTASEASITALKDVTPSLDCNNVSVASDVATFKVAAEKTRDNLKAYRTAVKALLHSLETTSDTSSTTSTTTTTSTGENQ